MLHRAALETLGMDPGMDPDDEIYGVSQARSWGCRCILGTKTAGKLTEKLDLVHDLALLGLVNALEGVEHDSLFLSPLVNQ